MLKSVTVRSVVLKGKGHVGVAVKLTQHKEEILNF
jgi:hypothetical protein